MNVARAAITEEKQHWARISIRKRGLNRRLINILGNTDHTQSHIETLISTVMPDMTYLFVTAHAKKMQLCRDGL